MDRRRGTDPNHGLARADRERNSSRDRADGRPIQRFGEQMIFVARRSPSPASMCFRLARPRPPSAESAQAPEVGLEVVFDGSDCRGSSDTTLSPLVKHRGRGQQRRGPRRGTLAQCAVGPPCRKLTSDPERVTESARRSTSVAKPLGGRNLPATTDQSRGGVLCRRLSARDRERGRGEA